MAGRRDQVAEMPIADAHSTDFSVRPYLRADRPALRARMLGAEPGEFGLHAELVRRYPRMRTYCADGLCHYYDLEPESCFVAEASGAIIGNLFGAVNTTITEEREATYVRDLRRRKLLSGVYGIPVWLLSIVRTSMARPIEQRPEVDLNRLPAHLHMGVVLPWQRRGVGSALIAAYMGYLRNRGVPGFHLYASSFHDKGVAFYRKVGLEEIGTFRWRFHDGVRWHTPVEHVFVRNLVST